MLCSSLFNIVTYCCMRATKWWMCVFVYVSSCRRHAETSLSLITTSAFTATYATQHNTTHGIILFFYTALEAPIFDQFQFCKNCKSYCLSLPLIRPKNPNFFRYFHLKERGKEIQGAWSQRDAVPCCVCCVYVLCRCVCVSDVMSSLIWRHLKVAHEKRHTRFAANGPREVTHKSGARGTKKNDVPVQ